MPADAMSFRQSLLALLQADPPHEEKLLAELERRKDEPDLHSSLLYILTHLTFSEAEARRHWRRIVAHRDLLRMRLGRDAGLRVALLDYFVNVNRELRSPKVIEISIYERTARSAVTDGLTGLYNHAYLLQALRREVLRSRRHALSVSLAMFDLDDFKRLNDTRGHLEGDKVLIKAASLLTESLRGIDIAARYGGEEFAVILPDTSRAGAYTVAERIRARIEEHFGRRKGAPRVTISGGIAAYPYDAQGLEDLLRRADEGLYRAKAEGKNRICFAHPERRRHARVPLAHSVTLKAPAGEAAPARTANVSAGGLLLNLTEPVPVGSPVSVVIRPGAGSERAFRAEVVRVAGPGSGEGYEVGVRFLATPSRALVTLRRLGALAAEA